MQDLRSREKNGDELTPRPTKLPKLPPRSDNLGTLTSSKTAPGPERKTHKAASSHSPSTVPQTDPFDPVKDAKMLHDCEGEGGERLLILHAFVSLHHLYDYASGLNMSCQFQHTDELVHTRQLFMRRLVRIRFIRGLVFKGGSTKPSRCREACNILAPSRTELDGDRIEPSTISAPMNGLDHYATRVPFLAL